jgi:hypothetical protein
VGYNNVSLGMNKMGMCNDFAIKEYENEKKAQIKIS